MKIRIRKTDQLFSLYIRRRAKWKCERCGKQYQEGDRGLQCSHFWGRAKESTRFDTENCTALCHGCHACFTANPELHRAWQLKRLGQKRYYALMIRANTPKKKDDKMIEIYLNKLLETL